ncbi:MAG: alpha-glucan family phosphorylase [Rhizomicrobium sp.]
MVALQLPKLPDEISFLQVLALDLRWTWNHEADALWEQVDKTLWERTHSPWTVLQSASTERLKALTGNSQFLERLKAAADAYKQYQETPGWFRLTPAASKVKGVAYLSMEFGLGAALPLYAGGLGILAGDFLKTASDLDVPIIGVGLLYQEGYFRQVIDNNGAQQEFYPYNEPSAMPIEPVVLPDGRWLRVEIDLPGRKVSLRIWQAQVGKVKLYLLDSNDALNSPPDRGITTKLYGGGTELRLMQEIVLGVGGWRVVEALHPDVEICHINEGHAAFAILERAYQQAQRSGLTFWEALWATRAGNVFTTHTPVSAGFDRFPVEILVKYLRPYVEGSMGGRGLKMADVLALGRADKSDASEPFNMAFFAARGSAICMGVSALHGEVSRRIFQPLFFRWPSCEVPIGFVTNGVHVPTWDSAGADDLWTQSCGKDRWRHPPSAGASVINVSDEDLWAMRGAGRMHIVQVARGNLAKKMREHGYTPDMVRKTEGVLDPNVLTLGFARRFTEYKRPNLLLSDPGRLEKLLLDETRPVQIVVAGKAHPDDYVGKGMIQEWLNLARQHKFRRHIVFIEDYDIAIAQEMVQGVDVWINTPRRPWEACGTSGMKVLVNGGINCSTLDGWWDEAYTTEVGWAIGSGDGGVAEEVDVHDAKSLYDLLENSLITEFYDRDADGLPRAWLKRIRESMSQLTSQFGGARMIEDYVNRAYLPQSLAVRERLKGNCSLAKAMYEWSETLSNRWQGLHIGAPKIADSEKGAKLSVPIFLGEISPEHIRVELYADAKPGVNSEIIVLNRDNAIAGSINGFIYAGVVAGARPVQDYTVRIVPYHQAAFLPTELPLISWQQ